MLSKGNYILDSGSLSRVVSPDEYFHAEDQLLNSVNLWGFYAIGGNIRKLASLQGSAPLAECHAILSDAEIALNFLLYNENMLPLEDCRGSGGELWNQLRAHIQRANAQPEAPLGEHECAYLQEALKAFDIILRNTLASAPAYFVVPKGILSTSKLVNAAEEMLSKAVLQRLSGTAVSDIRAAGRCLAFNLPTSVGFHILRALEAVVIDYIVRKTGTRPTKRDLGEYVRILKAEGANEDVSFVIDQIRRLHRNPLMHPEDTLTEDESIDLFLLCRSAINATVADMETKHLFAVTDPSAAVIPGIP